MSGYTANVPNWGKAKGGKRKRPRWVRWLKISLAAFSLLFLTAFGIFLAIFIREKNDARQEVVRFQQLSRDLQIPPSEIVSSDGTLLYQVSDELREYAPLTDIPKMVQQAMIAAEDRRFYEHSGVDYRAIVRTIFSDMREGRPVQGASTLTMQLAKLVSSKGEKTISRKLHDMALAMAIEESLSKDQILELYLNEVYFGSHAYGIKAAADVYFGKPLDKLSVSEAAFLVRLVRRPSTWNNVLNKENLDTGIRNRDAVLAIMRDEKMITQSQYESAKRGVLKFNPRPPKSSARILRAPYFVSHVLDTLRQQFPDINLSDGGYRVVTTLDAKMEEMAEREVKRVVQEHKADRVSTAAFVLMNAKGQILAEVGGVDYDRNQFNVISQGHRQPGSSFKPFVYATAFATGALSMNDTLANEVATFPAPPGGKPYTVHNADNHYSPTTSVINAFALSKNVPAVHVIDRAGPATVVQYCHDYFGFTSELYPGLALALGSSVVNPLEMAQGYSVFATGGDRATPYVIQRIVGPDGEPIHEFTPRIEHHVLDPTVCGEIDSLMRDVVEFGTGYRAKGVPNARGKTGTTNSNYDAWFCGYTDGLIGIGWIANEHMHTSGPPTYSAMGHNVYGGTVTVEFWASVMKAAHDKYGATFAPSAPATATPKPAPVIENPADALAKDGVDAKPLTPVGDSGTSTPPSSDTSAQDDEGQASPGPATPDSGAKPPAKPPNSNKEDDTVRVEICVDSGLRATVYCPETVTKTFKKGQEPKKYCNVHSG